MEKKPRMFLLLVLLNLKVFAQGQPDQWVGIDCGSNRSTATFGLIWETDEEFIKSGTNHFIPDDTLTALAIFKTLRAFTDQNKNCYTLPRTSSNGYFIRAAFVYANYDGFSRPPTFDLEIDGNKWTTVVTSSADYTYHEILYWTQNRNVSVCLARTQTDQFPFISSLEFWPISYDMYTELSHGLAWLKSYRYDYGPNTGILGYLGGDEYNRIWEAIDIAGGTNTSGGSVYSCVENPPISAVEDAVEGEDNVTSLFLTFSPVKAATPIYIEAYFTQMGAGSLDSRVFEMYVAGNSFGTITPDDEYCTTQSGFVQVSSSNLTIELQPTAQSTLPPIISAIEIYTATDPLITTGTDQNDLNGLMSFTNTYDRLKGWSGEPCLPTDTVWQWLGCAPTTHPPRVTSLYLSGYQLNGGLTNFSQMQALVDIDLSKNNLSGEIPAFLGKLPNLRTLNLSYNDFSGAVPASIRNNRRLTYDVTGNPYLDSSGKDGSSKATIIGLAVGIPLLVAAIILLLLFWLIRKRANNQGTEAETPHPTAPPGDEENCIAVDMKPNDESMVPDMELDELEGLIDQYENDGDHDLLQPPYDDDNDGDDCVAVGEHTPIHASNDESMVPDLDLEELHQIIQQEKDKARISDS